DGGQQQHGTEGDAVPDVLPDVPGGLRRHQPVDGCLQVGLQVGRGGRQQRGQDVDGVLAAPGGDQFDGGALLLDARIGFEGDAGDGGFQQDGNLAVGFGRGCVPQQLEIVGIGVAQDAPGGGEAGAAI